jgi:hypothetical protein
MQQFLDNRQQCAGLLPENADGVPFPARLGVSRHENDFRLFGRFDVHKRLCVLRPGRGASEKGTGQTPSALIDGKWQHRQFLRVEEVTYENGVFKFLRIWNADETDWGLSFGAEPVVLRVSLATY